MVGIHSITLNTDERESLSSRHNWNREGDLPRMVIFQHNGSAATPFTYDTAWGGLVSCGCLFNDKEKCDNVFPDCPAYSDPLLNFGNGFYNDHHFHYGYHIYAASIVAEYDREWGRKHFEQVLLYVRDIANPSAKDKYFPKFRQKDWYLGNSWASGIATIDGRPYLNGRNQESSSEAIAAYEAVSMFGSVMMKAFGNGISTDESYNKNANVACQIFNIGQFLTATEIRSADRYWHVYSPKRNKVYPDSYTPPAIGMMWDTMTQFQTWFGSEPYLAYGIQSLPLTPISERSDSDQWIRQLYPSYAASCEADPVCVKEGWSVMVYAVLATLGHQDAAINKTLDLPHSAYNTAGGNGHSLTNTLWYIASRPTPIVPYDLDNPSTTIDNVAVPA
jgi:endo-1,3(4)-beta-glucanase